MTRAAALGLCGVLAAAPHTAEAEPRLLEGPTLMDVRPESIAVLFELSEPAPAEVTVRRFHGESVGVFRSPRGSAHELVLGGLSPSGAYTYTLSVAGRARAEGHFSTAPTSGSQGVHFLVMGDNRSDAIAHAAVIHAMISHPADFVLNTGDMVANGGNEADWRRMFGVEHPLLRDVPLFPTMGNHEIYLNGIGLSGFLKHTRVPHTQDGAETYYELTYGPVRILVLDSNDDWAEPSAQRRWLEERLAAAADTPEVEHVFVAVHQGPISSGYHGGQPGMVATGIVPLLRSHGVSLVLSGHDHDYERGDTDGLKYIVTGGGGAPLYRTNTHCVHQQRFESSYHFLAIDVDGARVDMRAIRTDGSLIERCAFEEAGPWECDTPADPLDARHLTRPPVTRPRGALPWWTLLLGLIAVCCASILLRHLRRRTR